MRIRSNVLCTAVVATALALAACNPKEPGQPNPPAPQTSNGVLSPAQQEALNKARNVGDVLQQGVQRSESDAQ